MKRNYQALPKWELERAARRAAFREGVTIVVGGLAVAVIVGLFLFALFVQ